MMDSPLEVLSAEQLVDHPLTDRVIAATLADKGAMTYDDLTTETGIPRRTVKSGILRLRDANLVVSEPLPTQPRLMRHRLAIEKS